MHRTFRGETQKSTADRERGGLAFRPEVEKAKARQCFKRCTCNRGPSTRFAGQEIIFMEPGAASRVALEKLIPVQKEVVATDRKWIDLMIMPYGAVYNAVDGPVITLMDIT